MEIRKRTVEQIERDLYWARHIANHGTSVAQRERGKRNVEVFEHELTVARRVIDVARQTLPAAAGLPLTPAGNGFIGKRMRNVPPQTGIVLQSKVHGGR